MRIEGASTTFDLDGSAKNTLIEYGYRDADNYKVTGRAVLEGRLEGKHAEAIARSLEDGRYFIPGQVGLRDLQGDFKEGSEWSEADHVWHSLNRVSYTNDAPTTGQDACDVDGLVSEWPERDGWDADGHAATLSASSGPSSRP